MYQYSAEAFITAMNEVPDGEDLVVRINSEGGSPEYGWGMVAKFSEFKNKKLVKVDGMAHSMALYYLCYADDAEALDVAQFTLHRAAYSAWFEKSEYMTDDMWNTLNAVNKKLRAALEAKIDVAKFEALKGVKVADIFSNDTRIDVTLTASEAKKIGLINRTTNITPAKKAEITGLVKNLSMGKETETRIAALYAAEVTSAPLGNREAQDGKKLTDKNLNKMDILTLRAEHPAVYAEIMKLGAAEERNRVGAWMAYSEIDAAAVKKGIEDGSELTTKAMAEFQVKALSAEGLKSIMAGNPPAVAVGKEAPVATTEAQKNIAAFEAALDKNLNLKTA